MLNPAEVKTVLETALLTTQEPMSIGALRKLFEDDVGADTIRRLLDEIREQWNDRGVELVNLATGWRFQTRPQMQQYLERVNGEKAPRYSRAVLETLAIIAYRQPVTRGDIEDIRGVTVSQNVIKTLESRAWIDVVGHRDAPGKPALYATTKAFLDDLGLRSLQELPPLEEISQSIDSAATPASVFATFHDKPQSGAAGIPAAEGDDDSLDRDDENHPEHDGALERDAESQPLIIDAQHVDDGDTHATTASDDTGDRGQRNQPTDDPIGSSPAIDDTGRSFDDAAFEESASLDNGQRDESPDDYAFAGNALATDNGIAAGDEQAPEDRADSDVQATGQANEDDESDSADESDRERSPAY